VPVRVVAQRSNEDEVHILSHRPLSQWALCGEVVGHDWLVRTEDVELSRNVIDVCTQCRRTMWRHLKNDSRDFPLQEQKVSPVRTLWERLRMPFGAPKKQAAKLEKRE